MELQRSLSCDDDEMVADYESSVTQEKKDSARPVSVKTDKSGRLLLETPADLQNLLLLRKTKKEQKAAVRKSAAPPAAPVVPYYVDEEDFFKACDQNQLLLIDRYLETGGDVNARDSFEHTGLHRASSKGHTEVITKLIEAGVNVHLRDKLWLCAAQVHVSSLRLSRRKRERAQTAAEPRSGHHSEGQAGQHSSSCLCEDRTSRLCRTSDSLRSRSQHTGQRGRLSSS
nr:ankyrin repeat domain-containing protein 1-like isoform X2 [Labrus bergylta]